MKRRLSRVLLLFVLAIYGLPVQAHADGATDTSALASCTYIEDGLPNLGKLKSCLSDYHSGQYLVDMAYEVGRARKAMEDQIAANTDHRKLALVLDIDETALSNWEKIAADDFGYFADGPCPLPVKGPCGAVAFDQLARATTIKPTLELFDFAVAHGVAIFFITGREDKGMERIATELNLWRAGYHGWTELYMREDHDKAASTRAYKTGRRKDIERGGYTIIANLGDQQSDLQGGHPGMVFDFKLPNPFYYIP